MCYMTRLCLIFSLVIFTSPIHGNEDLLESFIQLGPEGKGNEELVNNWHLVKKMSSSDIPKLLETMNKTNALGDNWIRAAIFEILNDSGKESLPNEEIIRFIKDKKNEGSSRSTAYDFLKQMTPQIAVSLIPTFIDDPETTLRREGVQMLLDQAHKLENKEQAIDAYQYALGKAREVDQIESACQSLESLGEKIDLPKRMGFLTTWKVIGPFDNTSRNGFGTTYSPEKNKSPLNSVHLGKNGPVKWQPFSTSDRLGLMDLNQPFGHIKEVLCYAYSEFGSSTDQRVHFRIGSKNAWKLWVNQELVFARDEYHRGATRVDQFILEGNLKKGKNEILEIYV